MGRGTLTISSTGSEAAEFVLIEVYFVFIAQERYHPYRLLSIIADKIDDIRALLPSRVKEDLAEIDGLSAVS
jgi:hypothetical protein